MSTRADIEESPLDWSDSVVTDTRKFIQLGLASVGGFLLFFSLWATTAPLSSAVIAMSTVEPIGENKLVQHQTGGTVLHIHASDGQRVKKGDPIITLDPIIDQTELSSLKNTFAQLLAIEARVMAEHAGKEAVLFPEALYQSQASEDGAGIKERYAQIMSDQSSEFSSNRMLVKNRLSEMDQQVSSNAGRMNNLKNQKNNLAQERSILREQLARIQPLLKKGYYSQEQADNLQRQFFRVSSDHDRVAGDIIGLKFNIEEIANKKAAEVASMKAGLSSQLSSVRGDLVATKNLITAANSTLGKRAIRSPVDGVLTNSAFHTVGGVVGPRDVIAQVVPFDGYTLEARIALQDIDYVHLEQTADVMVTAFNRKLNDPLPATVEYVSANTQVDSVTGEQFYTARLTINESEESHAQLSKLKAGMQAEVYIHTGERTFLSYLIKPFSDGFSRAFQER